jgi:hypothetical protein
MSTLDATLTQAHALGAGFVLQGGMRLIVQAPAALPAELMAELRRHKPALVAAFTERCGWCQSRQLWAPASGRTFCHDCHAVFNPSRGGWSPGERVKRRLTSHLRIDTMERP